MNFDPRDYDSRDDERDVNPSSHGSRGGPDDRDRDDDWNVAFFSARDGNNEIEI